MFEIRFRVLLNKTHLFFIFKGMKLPLHLFIWTEVRKNVCKFKLQIKIEINIYSEEKINCNIQDIFM